MPLTNRSADGVAGFGPLQRHLDDPMVEEIWINEPGRVFLAGRGRSGLPTTILNDGMSWVDERLLLPGLVRAGLRVSVTPRLR